MKKRPRRMKLFTIHDDMIKHEAHRFASSTGHSADEFYSEGLVAFMKAIRTWDSRKSSFKTWLRRTLRNSMIDFTRKNDPVISSKQILHYVDKSPFTMTEEDDYISIIPDNSHAVHPDKELMWKERILELSMEAVEVIAIILAGPTEILDIAKTSTPKAVRGALVRYLRNEGWGWNTIWGTFDEIKTAMKY